MTTWYRLTIEVLRQRIIRHRCLTVAGGILGTSVPENYKENVSLVFMDDETDDLNAMLDVLRGDDSRFAVAFDVSPISPKEATEEEMNDIRTRRDREDAWQKIRQVMQTLSGNSALIAVHFH